MKFMRKKFPRRLVVHHVDRFIPDSLHSPDARLRMLKYKIGRVEGRWSNFLPPIQGGSFRPFTEAAESVTSDGDSDSASSQDDSPPRSPIFDVADGLIPPRRSWRDRASEKGETSSISSMSSVELDNDLTNPPLGHMDIYTKEEIDLDLAKYPPLDPATQDDIVNRYRMLNDRIKAENLYQCDYTSYLVEIGRYAFLFGLCLLFLSWGWYGTSGACMAMFWHQLVFTAHDAGHMGITHDFTIDTIIGVIVADFLGGLSLGWWKRSHNVHHIVTNSPEHDPDIEHMPFFVSIRSIALYFRAATEG